MRRRWRPLTRPEIDPRRAAVYLDRGAERLAGGDRDGGLADFAEAVRREPARAADVLTAVERRADKESPADGATLPRTLTTLRPLFQDKPECKRRSTRDWPRRIREGSRTAGGEIASDDRGGSGEGGAGKRTEPLSAGASRYER